MTLKSITELVGLKSTDAKIIEFFETQSLASPPKTITSNQSSKDFKDKKTNIVYYFKYHIDNDNFYPPVSPKNDNYKFECYLYSIAVFEKSSNKKKAIIEYPIDFWKGFINPNSNFEECEAYFNGTYKTSEYSIFFSKPLNDFIEIKVWFSTDKKELKTIEVSIITHNELVSYIDFKQNNIYNTTKQAYTLLVKWLFDNQYLQLPSSTYVQGLSLDHNEILTFVTTHLKKHIWDNQITDTEGLRSFLYKITSNNDIEVEDGKKINVFIKHLFIKSSGLWDKHQKIYENDEDDDKYKKIDELESGIVLNEAQSNHFLKTLSDMFELFKKYKKTEVW
jgi:hypothetical protein